MEGLRRSSNAYGYVSAMPRYGVVPVSFPLTTVRASKS
jgi:hypothetical protein